MAHGGQADGVQRPGGAPPFAAGGAAEHPLAQIQPRLRRRLLAAERADVQQRFVSRHAQKPELKGGFYQRRRLVQPVQGIYGVEQQGQQRLIRPSLLGHCLGHLGKVGAQGQLLHIPADPPKELQYLRLVEGNIVPVLKKRHIRPDQQLCRGRQRAVSPPTAPGLHRALAPFPGEDGQYLVGFLVVGLPQDQSLGHNVHPVTLYVWARKRPW